MQGSRLIFLSGSVAKEGGINDGNLEQTIIGMDTCFRFNCSCCRRRHVSGTLPKIVLVDGWAGI